VRGRLAATALTCVAALGAGATFLAGCRDDPEPPATACFEAGQVRAALRTEGEERVLPGDGSLSACVRRATSDEQLQSLGLVLTGVADGLAERARAGEAAAAEQLGYLLGAARRGASSSQGIGLELVRRLESSARRAGQGSPAAQEALRSGTRAGERGG
jgi:hypothetical protein